MLPTDLCNQLFDHEHSYDRSTSERPGDTALARGIRRPDQRGPRNRGCTMAPGCLAASQPRTRGRFDDASSTSVPPPRPRSDRRCEPQRTR
jgi:hypothetical protein